MSIPHDVTMVAVSLSITGQYQYKIVCWRCAVVVHDGTTGPASMLQSHFEGGGAYERPLDPSDGVPKDQFGRKDLTS